MILLQVGVTLCATPARICQEESAAKRSPLRDPEAPATESVDGLIGLVQQTLRGSTLDRTTFDEIWRELQRVRDTPLHLPAHEQLVAVDRAGHIIAVADGTHARVAAEGDLGEQLQQPGRDVVLIHNHPMGRGLSAADLGHLMKPGVKAVIAIGHDASLYAACHGKRFPTSHGDGPPVVTGIVLRRQTSIMTLVAIAIGEVARVRRTAGIDDDVFVSHFDHVVSLALGKIEAIDYRFALSAKRQESFRRFRFQFLKMIGEAGLKLAPEINRSIAAQSR